MGRSTFVYTSYIRTTPERLWEALTSAEFMTEYWLGCRAESAWTAGASWELKYPDGRVVDAGEIVEAERPRRLVIRWHHLNRPELAAEGDSLCTMEIEPTDSAVKLTITHAMERDESKLIGAVSGGWPKIISNLKSLLETGHIALTGPYPRREAATA